MEAAKTITFTIAASSTDKTAPVTTQTLTPASPGAGGTYAAPVTVKFSANDPAGRWPGGQDVRRRRLRRSLGADVAGDEHG